MRNVLRKVKKDHTARMNRGDQIMRGIVGITLANSFLVATLTFGEPVGGASLISLADSLTPLQEQFNAAVDKPRGVATLSPT